ncbi:MAG: hypothetical protein HND52_06880 [Ignavibacteriae bacterium]|nr:hypothetical protein [Ignavibacteriota bacterium]NOG97667.1 hypothetical protein [Ignavibacteriota bacterium]
MRLTLTFILLNLFFLACTEDSDPIQPPLDKRMIVKKFAYDYSQNHYFVDSMYASRKPELNLFEKYYNNYNPVVEPQYRIKEIEVWKSAQGYINIQKEIRANAFIDLPSKGAGHYPLDSPMRSLTQNEIPGQSVINGRFIRLESGIDYELNPYCGLISFINDVGNDYQIAVSYRLDGEYGDDNDIYYGEFISDLPTDTNYTVLLKLVKPKNLQPGFKRAWKNQLKNIYSINSNNFSEKDFEVTLFYRAHPLENSYLKSINDVSLIKMFGLDNFDENGERNPDNNFDFLPGKTILLGSGDIIFPALEPFGSYLPTIFDETFRQNGIYEKSQSQASYSSNSRNFRIEVKYYPKIE